MSPFPHPLPCFSNSPGPRSTSLADARPLSAAWDSPPHPGCRGFPFPAVLG